MTKLSFLLLLLAALGHFEVIVAAGPAVSANSQPVQEEGKSRILPVDTQNPSHHDEMAAQKIFRSSAAAAVKFGHKIKKRVAIIGAGSGGSSAAYFLRKFTCPEKYDLDITIFERNSYIGGRSTTVNAYNDPKKPVELGASIFVEVNKNLVNAAKEFGLEVETAGISELEGYMDDNRDEIGIWNGRDFVFRQTTEDTSWWWNVAKMVWRYGLAPIKTNRLMSTTVGKFLKMYDGPVFPFKDLTKATRDVELLDATGINGKEYLVKNSIGVNKGSFATEIVQASTRVNYGQNLGLISGLETMVCMAADRALAVKGGNWRIFAGMVEAAKATIHLETLVTDITKHDDGKWTLKRKSLSANELGSAQPRPEIEEPTSYDAVVLATPYLPYLGYSNITFHPSDVIPPSNMPYAPATYVTLHVTLFTSPYRLSPKPFGLKPDEKVPLVVLTTLTPEEQEDENISGGSGENGVGQAGIWSVSTLREETNPKTGKVEYLYKIFSPVSNPLLKDEEVLQYLNVPEGAASKDAITWSYRKKWHPYPFLFPRTQFDKIVLDGAAVGEGDDGKIEGSLYYTSAIEPFISTMETSSLMGMNVAGLLVKCWGEQEGLPEGKGEGGKFEKPELERRDGGFDEKVKL